ncbi:hypothetical protein R3P38DRAFT_3354332 [Favolaschia claudopus]|uniref:Uncharacterized protein n=1 Tax=Favolaschia claudopus TaxID=2862362 RepID=A0AAW0BPP0_9AGAR
MAGAGMGWVKRRRQTDPAVWRYHCQVSEERARGEVGENDGGGQQQRYELGECGAGQNRDGGEGRGLTESADAAVRGLQGGRKTVYRKIGGEGVGPTVQADEAGRNRKKLRNGEEGGKGNIASSGGAKRVPQTQVEGSEESPEVADIVSDPQGKWEAEGRTNGIFEPVAFAVIQRGGGQLALLLVSCHYEDGAHIPTHRQPFKDWYELSNSNLPGYKMFFFTGGTTLWAPTSQFHDLQRLVLSLRRMFRDGIMARDDFDISQRKDPTSGFDLATLGGHITFDSFENNTSGSQYPSLVRYSEIRVVSGPFWQQPWWDRLVAIQPAWQSRIHDTTFWPPPETHATSPQCNGATVDALLTDTILRSCLVERLQGFGITMLKAKQLQSTCIVQALFAAR